MLKNLSSFCYRFYYFVFVIYYYSNELEVKSYLNVISSDYYPYKNKHMF